MPCGTTAVPTDHQPLTDGASLLDIVTAGDYDARVNALVARICEASDQATALSLLRLTVRTMGAEHAVFVSFVRDSVEVSACRFMLACDPAWCRQYLEGGHLTHDPWLAYAAHHADPIVASTLPIGDTSALQTVEIALRNGFASAVLAPAHSGAGHSRISLLCLGSSRAGFFEAEGFGHFRLGARLLAAELHDWWLARIRRELVVKSRISASDLDLLRHERQGHSSKRIAAELQVSTSSINSRFQRMNIKLGVPNRRVAARLAVECGLLLS